MKYLYSIYLLAVCFAVCTTLNVSAQNFHLLKDINSAKSSSPHVDYTLEEINKRPLPVLNNVGYFTADDGIHGPELWKSDGSGEGTLLVKDIIPGEAGASLKNITVFNDKIYFNATPGLWVSDGTNAGTKVIKESVSPDFLTVVGNSMYFVSGNQLWKTNGTETEMVADFSTVQFGNSSRLNGLTNINGRLYFSASASLPNAGYIARLWVTDGTAAGTYAVSNSALDPKQLTQGPGNLIYFSAKTSDNISRKLWVSTGSPGNANPATGNTDLILSSLTPVINQANVLYYIASQDGLHPALYKYDANTANAAVLIKEISIANQPAQVNYFSSANGILFIGLSSTGNAVNNGQLWKSDGTTTGTFMLKDSCFPQNFSPVNNLLYFSATGENQGREIWKSDGTINGTVIVKDICAGANSSNIVYSNQLTAITGNNILFAASDGNSGTELWKTDGTAAGTRLVKDINQSSSGAADVYNLTSFNNKIFFAASDGKTDGSLLWVSDGTTAGTDSIPNINALDFDSNQDGFTSLGSDIYFYGSNAITRSNGLYKSNGTVNGTALVKDLTAINKKINWAVATGSLVYFSTGIPNSAGYTLWRSDGTTAGTFEIKTGSFHIPYELSPNQHPVAVNNSLYFTLNTGAGSSSLWKTDGTAESTTMVSSVYSNPAYLCSYNGYLYFSGSINNVSYLVKSNGTESGTVKLNVSSPSGLTVSNGKLFIAGSGNYNGNNVGNELWVIEGNSNYANLVKNINPTQGAFEFFGTPNMLDVDGTLFFFANDGTHGAELWKSNGLEEGTQLVKDITSGPEGTALTQYAYWYPGLKMAAVNGKLCFEANEKVWISDGTDTGTVAVEDSNLSTVKVYNYFSGTGDNLFFLGYTYPYGMELYTGYIEASLFPIYVFIGDGNFNDPLNWSDDRKPPREIPAGVEILINPAVGGSCTLNVPLHIKGGKLRVKQNARFIVNGNLLIQ